MHIGNHGLAAERVRLDCLIDEQPEPRIILDECVNTKARGLAVEWLAARGWRGVREVKIRDRCRGAPDGEIARRFLDANCILITADRVFHNRALACGLRSVAVVDGIVTDRMLPIDIPDWRRQIALNQASSRFSSANHRAPPTPFRDILMPRGAKALENLRTKRRRIHSHFDGLGNIAETRVTVCVRMHGTDMLIGIRLRITALSSFPALDASESYVREPGRKEEITARAIFAALLMVIRLGLHGTLVRCYYDGTCIGEPEHLGHDAVTALRMSFRDLQFLPVTKGRWVERVRDKLDLLVESDPGNEMMWADIASLMRAISARQAERARNSLGRA